MLDLETYPLFVQHEQLVKYNMAHFWRGDVPLQEPQDKLIEEFIQGMMTIAEALCYFYAKVAEENAPQITIDDIMMDEACSREENGKLSGHIICPKFGFAHMEGMKVFVYQFITFMVKYEPTTGDYYFNRLPRYLTYAMPVKDPKTFGEENALIRRIGNSYTIYSAWYTTAIDILIYTKNRTMRCTGTSKIGSDRILRPVIFNRYWSNNCSPLYVSGEMIKSAVVAARNEWLVHFLSITCSSTFFVRGGFFLPNR